MSFTLPPQLQAPTRRLWLSGWLALVACSGERSGLQDFDGGSSSGSGDHSHDEAPAASRCGGDGDRGGDGDQGADAGGPAAPGCEDYAVEVAGAVANVMVVLDRSGSMHDLTVDRWDPSVAAVEDLAASLPQTLRLGLMTFPGDCFALPPGQPQADCLARQSGSALGEFSCEPGQVRVMPAEGTLDAIRKQLSVTTPAGATPTASTLRAAHQALKSLATGQSTQTVLLVTDGAPNCASGDQGNIGSVGIGIGTASTGQAAAIPQTVAAISDMAKDGIKTYVLGYDTQSDPTLKSALDSMAQAGGTGATSHYAVGSHATLLSALEKLADRTADCELVLKKAVVDPWKVQVTLDGKILTVTDPNGYALDAAGDNLTLLGSACEAVRAGNRHELRVKAVCPEAPIAPPPAPKPPQDAGPGTPCVPPPNPCGGDGDGDGDGDEVILKERCVPVVSPPSLPADAGAPVIY